MHLVCDRYAAYAKLAREEPERFVLALCWAHARRDFVDATVGRPQLGKWSGRWLERIAALYRGGAERARHWDRALPVGRQGAAFANAQGRLEGRAALFERARRELAALPADAPQGKPLRALERHREGLTAFVRAIGQQRRRRGPTRRRDRPQAVVRLAQRDRRGTGRPSLLRDARHARARRPAALSLAGGDASVRRVGRPAAGGRPRLAPGEWTKASRWRRRRAQGPWRRRA